ncbi:MAG: DUF3617 family protein [Alphaproteobacteria bacterium]
MTLVALAACKEKPSDAIKPLRPGLWRISSIDDHNRADIVAKPGPPVVSYMCARVDPRPAAVALSFQKGCTGPISLDTKDGVWNFTNTCAAQPGVATEGMVWGNFERAYLLERYVTTTDPADPAHKSVVHQSITAKWLGADCSRAPKR